MKTKKFIQALTALALCATMTAPVNAFAVTITPDGDTITGADVSGTNSGTSNILMNVEKAYTITIPATITLTDKTDAGGTEGDGVYTGEGTITVEDIHLPEGKSLEVKIGEGQSFAMTDQDTASPKYSIDYEVSTTSPVTNSLVADSRIKVFESLEGTDSAEQKLYFKTKKAVQYAGNYKGSITFTCALINTGS